MHLLVSLAAHGWHPAAWRVSGATGFEGVTPFRTGARLAESGGLDAVLLGLPTAPPALREKGTLDSLPLDPLPLLGALISVTRRIGLCAYWPADVAEPYHVARVFATLDYLAAGRTGWIAGIAGPEELAEKYQRLDLPSAGREVEARFVELIDVARSCGTAGKTRATSSTSRPALLPIPIACIPSITKAASSLCVARSTCRGRCRGSR